MRHPDGSTTWTSPVGRTYDRPSPHEPPPHVDLHVDLHGELPPVRPRPGPGTPADDEQWRSWEVEASPLHDDRPDDEVVGDEVVRDDDDPPPF